MAENKGPFENRKGEIHTTGVMDRVSDALGTPLKGEALQKGTRYTFLAAGIASLLLAAFSLILPHTPPKKSGEPLAWLEAMSYLAKPFILVLFIVTFLDAAIHQSFFYWAATFLKGGVDLPGNWVMPVMSIGQVAEVATMAFLGYVLKSLGWRMTMTIGILGHAARFAVFAFAGDLPQQYQQPAAIAVNILHGVCYAFFFATLYIFIDEYFPKDARASAQGLFNMLILGVGPFVSNFVSGKLADHYKTGETFNFRGIFLVPMGTALVAAVLLMAFFHPPKKAKSDVPT
jgi:MFS family permease